MTEYDYRWTKKDGTKCTYLETLQAMCDRYSHTRWGTYSSFRFYCNEDWQTIAKQIPQMNEEEAEKKVREIEADADAELEYWRRTQ